MMKQLQLQLLLVLVIIPLLFMATTLSNVHAGDANCETDPDDPRCTGEKGAGGMNFCDLAWSDPADVDRFGDCYDRDFSRIDCEEHPGHSRCGGTTGREGLIFCDRQQEEMGFQENCYDRNDNPKEYCDNYAIDESDRWYTAEFCQSICDNYEEVINRGEECGN
jgi:hypothetical protein